jgi:signal transduction histidine kinase
MEIENERVYSLNFIDVIKNQNRLKINAENEAVRSRRIAKEQLVIITIGTFALIALAVLAVLALVNYQRQRFFGKELTKKNVIIEKNANSLDQLNKEISNQNALLEEDNKNKNKLLSIISHDLRTPLVNTKGILNLFNMGMVHQVASENLMQQLETQYQRTTTLLDNLLYWIKGQISGQDVHNESINFYQLVKSLEQEYHASLANKHLQFLIHIDKNLMIYAEKEMIQIIFRNLLSNAIKFTPPSGIIEIESSSNENFMLLTLKDNGIGMSPENLEKVMARKYFSTKGTELERGSGFGLMLCKDLITRQGGDMMIQTHPGAGTAITVLIPHVNTKNPVV